MPLELLILYTGLCFVAGYFGRNRRIGFWGFFFASTLFSPILSLLFLFFTAPNEQPKTADAVPPTSAG
ncbi:MAG TPA: hypothetical protein PLP29_00145 [Candidatus Ozemobacteraceae bacterium]|nr:hypothetical protein [Candidatus Ozemobacteraceae bacterium]